MNTEPKTEVEEKNCCTYITIVIVISGFSFIVYKLLENINV
jgi:hypothetical protein